MLDCRQSEVFAGGARDAAYVRIQDRAIQFEGFREGHIPGAKNLPYTRLFDVADENLREIFEGAGLDLSMPVAVVGSGGRRRGADGGVSAHARRVRRRRGAKERYVCVVHGARELVSDVHR